jgi:Tfp pilus assembly protein PilV
MKGNTKAGFVLIEVLLATAIASFAVCGILFLYVVAMDLVRTSKNASIATSAAEGIMEKIRNSSFNKIAFTPAEDPQGFKDMLFTVNGIPNSMGRVYVDDTDPEFLLITVEVCWRQGNRTVGEDTNLNGQLDAGEDTNGNGIIDSPVELVTQVVNELG